MSIKITKCVSTTNTTSKKGRSIEYVVLHYTAGTTSKSGAAKNTANFFMGGSASGSADFIVDDENIIQYNPDISNRYCWSVGGSKYPSMSTSEGGKYYDECTNANSISIEICSNKTNTSSLLASDTDWYFTEASVANAVALTKYLMEQYNIDADHVIMHHGVTGKVCPNPWCVNENRLSQWYAFKAQLGENEVDTEMVTTGTITVNGKNIKIDKIVKDDTTYIKLRGLEEAGFDVDFDPDTKNLVLNNTVKSLDVAVDGNIKSLDVINIGGYNYSKLRDFADVTGVMEIEYKDKVVMIDTK